jgi:hypothetical protein
MATRGEYMVDGTSLTHRSDSAIAAADHTPGPRLPSIDADQIAHNWTSQTLDVLPLGLSDPKSFRAVRVAA